MTDINQILPKVSDILADVLAIDASDVALNKRLIADLGAESIDFLDITFQLEKAFEIRIPRGQIEKDLREAVAPDDFEKSGVITDKGLQALKTYLCEVPENCFKPTMKVVEIPTLFTVETFCKLVMRALETKQKEQQAA